VSLKDGPSVERYVARNAIIESLLRYAYLAKEQADFPSMVPLFTPSGTFTLPNGVSLPSTQISAIVAAGEPNYIRHHVTTTSVEFVDDDTATSDTYFIAFTDIAQPDHWGRWEDHLERQEDGRWLSTDKRVVIEGWAPVSFWADLMSKVGG
jgi:hypothetical protein